MSSLKLHGVVPPVVTPLTPDFQVDKPALRRVVRHLLEGGVHGLFVLGSTSECVFLDSRQRGDVLETVAQENNGRVPMVAGTMDPATGRVIEHARQARAAGVQGLVVTAPFYTRTSQVETMEHFRMIRAAVDLPILAYDLPVCVHIKLERPLLRTLHQEGVICALKDSSGDDGNMRMVMRDFIGRDDFSILTGSETTCDYALLGGAHGLVPGLGNVDPGGYVRLYDAARRGDWSAARAEQERLIALFQIVFQGVPETSPNASGVGGFKTAMQQMGLIPHRHMSLPNKPLSDEQAARVKAIIAKAGLL